ncbi:MAG: transglutaminase-like domain-containing protein [Gemmatimonadales bacterium]
MIENLRPCLRTSGAIAVLLAWVASLGWLGVRRLDRSESAILSSEATMRLAPATAWYAVYAGATQIGNASLSLDTLSPGYRVDQSIAYEVRNGDSLTRAARRTETWLGATLNLERMVSRFSRAGQQAEWRLSIFGDTLTAHFAGQETIAQGRARFSDPPTATAALAYRLALGGALEPGSRSAPSRLVVLVDGWPAAGRDVEVTVGRDSTIRFADSTALRGGHWVAAHVDSVKTWAVVLHGAAGPRRLWIDQRGAVSGMETPLGVRWVRTDFDLSETEFRNGLGAGTAAIRGAVPVMVQYAAAPARTEPIVERRFVVAHRDGSPVDTSLVALLAGGRQEVHGDTIIERLVPEHEVETEDDAPDDPMIQDGAAAIAALDRSWFRRAPDSARVARAVASLRRMIRVDTAAGAHEDALGTLASRTGRPDGVARLFVALMRAAGIPARYVVGIEARGDTLLTHAWAEVWNHDRGGWWAVDPVSGMAMADTRLIRVAFAGSSHPDELLPMVANARIVEIAQEKKR